MRLSYVLATAAAAVLAGVTSVNAQTIIQPTSAQSKDTFVYSFLSTFNFNALSGFNTVLASGKSTGGHDLRSLLQFDLTGVSLGAGQIATLNLFVSDGGTVGFPVVNPTPAFPVIADVYPVTAAWDVATVTWATQPTFGGLAGSTSIDGINKYVSIDVTSLVQSWLAAPATNFGFDIQQRDIVVNGGSVQAVYHSADNTQRPFLYVGPVPEPTGLTVLASAASMLMLRRRS